MTTSDDHYMFSSWSVQTYLCLLLQMVTGLLYYKGSVRAWFFQYISGIWWHFPNCQCNFSLLSWISINKVPLYRFFLCSISSLKKDSTDNCQKVFLLLWDALRTSYLFMARHLLYRYELEPLFASYYGIISLWLYCPSIFSSHGITL